MLRIIACRFIQLMINLPNSAYIVRGIHYYHPEFLRWKHAIFKFISDLLKDLRANIDHYQLFSIINYGWRNASQSNVIKRVFQSKIET